MGAGEGMNANTTGWVAELEDVVGRMMPRLLMAT